MEILILYYSRYGNVKHMAELVARGVESVEGATARIRTVPPVSPSTEATDPTIPDSGHPYVTLEDMKDCDGLCLGSPTRFGNMAAPMKYFWETMTPLWFTGDTVGKPAGVFTSTGSLHGGQETTLITMMIPLFHLGYVIAGVPYTESELNTTTTGGTPYGPSHVAGPDSKTPVSEDEKALCVALGKRIAGLALKLGK